MDYKIKRSEKFEPVTIEMVINSQDELNDFTKALGKTTYSFGRPLFEELISIGAKVDVE